MRKKWIVMLSVTALILMFWFASVVKCEVLTLVYGKEFCEIYDSNTMIGDLEYFKVLNYSKTRSEVYFVSEGKITGHIVVFTKEHGAWNINSWKTIWSKSGSADGFVWPYIR